VPNESAEELVSELALLDRAHRALDSADTPLALSMLDRRDLEFVHGDLAPESLALRIEAYAQRRDGVKVRELGQSFLSRYPSHPQVRRVQSLMDGSARP
jgi:outer membrane protein assembly factor BamD (BamD/ComL family)